MSDTYQEMWEEFGKQKGEILLSYKFEPTHRVGLTNYLREELIYKFLDPQLSDSVLDIGCASGRQLFKIATRIREGQGVDIAASFIERANRNKSELGITNLFFKQSLIESLPFSDEQFDKIICAEVLEHVFDKDKALKEILRVLKKGGFLVVSVPNLNADATWWGRLLRLLKIRKFESMEHFSVEEIQKHGDAHVREFDYDTLSAWMKANGLEVKELKSASFIDGPKFDFLIKIPLHISPLRKLVINFEQWLTNRKLFWSRHLVIKSLKH